MSHFLIVGGSSGIGAALVERLVGDHELTVISRNPDNQPKGCRLI
ncbi:MAG: NAD(P)-dependent dehydrogenase (short-subunit alcohol dehydrogenase family), partial [Planctomycetota bacterium]